MRPKLRKGTCLGVPIINRDKPTLGSLEQAWNLRQAHEGVLIIRVPIQRAQGR